MNADILKRMVRAIADGSQTDLERIARRAVDSERKNGHGKLADQLEEILNKPKPKRNGSGVEPDSDRALSEFPLSRRHGEQLATLVLRDSLEHHMVLPAEIEDRFARIEKEYAARERLGAYGLKNRKTILLNLRILQLLSTIDDCNTSAVTSATKSSIAVPSPPAVIRDKPFGEKSKGFPIVNMRVRMLVWIRPRPRSISGGGVAYRVIEGIIHIQNPAPLRCEMEKKHNEKVSQNFGAVLGHRVARSFFGADVGLRN